MGDDGATRVASARAAAWLELDALESREASRERALRVRRRRRDRLRAMRSCDEFDMARGLTLARRRGGAGVLG